MEASTAYTSNSLVTVHRKCQSSDAKYLMLLDFVHKVKTKGEYEIGGTYSNGPDFWFMYRTCAYMSDRYLVSLFVCNRRPGSFTLIMGNTKVLSHNSQGDSGDADKLYINFGEEPDFYDFFNLPADTYSFVNTYSFTADELTALTEKEVFIQTSIRGEVLELSRAVTDNVKLSHDFATLLRDSERADVILESSDKHKFRAHKIILAANSSVLRKMLQESTEENGVSIVKLEEPKSEVELLLEFLYTGGVAQLSDNNCVILMKMGSKYEISGLTQLSQHTVRDQINVENAVEILLLTDKYQLDSLQKDVFQFMRSNPAVFTSDAWTNLKDIELTKKLITMYSL